jgi:hypothetical protein
LLAAGLGPTVADVDRRRTNIQTGYPPGSYSGPRQPFQETVNEQFEAILHFQFSEDRIKSLRDNCVTDQKMLSNSFVA